MKKLYILIFLCFLLTGCTVKGMNAKQWIVDQYASLDTIQIFCSNLDDVVALYISGAIDTEDYLTEISTLSEQFQNMSQARVVEDIKPGTHTEETKIGMNGYEKLWSDLSDLLELLQKDETLITDANKLSYQYMAYNEIIASDMNSYMEGYNYVISEKGES